MGHKQNVNNGGFQDNSILQVIPDGHVGAITISAIERDNMRKVKNIRIRERGSLQ